MSEAVRWYNQALDYELKESYPLEKPIYFIGFIHEINAKPVYAIAYTNTNNKIAITSLDGSVLPDCIFSILYETNRVEGEYFIHEFAIPILSIDSIDNYHVLYGNVLLHPELGFIY